MLQQYDFFVSLLEEESEQPKRSVVTRIRFGEADSVLRLEANLFVIEFTEGLDLELDVEDAALLLLKDI